MLNDCLKNDTKEINRMIFPIYLSTVFLAFTSILLNKTKQWLLKSGQRKSHTTPGTSTSLPKPPNRRSSTFGKSKLNK